MKYTHVCYSETKTHVVGGTTNFYSLLRWMGLLACPITVAVNNGESEICSIITYHHSCSHNMMGQPFL